jgi:prophage regulatory protein
MNQTSGFLRLPEVLKLFPVSKSGWYAGVRAGNYPAPVKLGQRTSAWRAEDIHKLIAETAGKS